MFDWTVNEARRDRVAREIQKAVARSAGRRDARGATLLDAPVAVEALLGVLATLMEGSPACASPEGVDAVAAEVGDELRRLVRDVRSLRAGRPG